MVEIVLEKYTVTPEYEVPKPEWDKDNCVEDKTTLYGTETTIFVAAISADPPYYAVSENGFVHAVSKLVEQDDIQYRLNRLTQE